MADSLVLGTIELLGGMTPSDQPGLEGTYIRLGNSFDLGAPAWTGVRVAGLLYAGEQLTSLRASNRAPVLPVVIIVPPSGDQIADRAKLAAAREYVLQTASAEQLRLTWTRDGGLPLVLDIQGVTTTTIEYSVVRDRNLCSLLSIACEAYPFGHSDTEEQILLTAVSSLWPVPPAPVTIDAFATAVNFLANLGGQAATMEGGIALWEPAAGGNCTVAPSTAQAHGGTGSMLMTAIGAGAMTADHCPPGDPSVLAYGLHVDPGDTITIRGWVRAVTTARTASIGAEYYDVSGTLVGSAAFGTGVTDSSSAWTQATASLVVPAGVNYAVVATQIAAAAAGEGHYWDDIYIDDGPVYSTNDPNLWNSSTQSPIASGHSAAWSRADRDAPTYERLALPAPLDITGRTKITFYAGLATSRAQAGVWHEGYCWFRIELFDANGNDNGFWAYRFCRRLPDPDHPALAADLR